MEINSKYKDQLLVIDQCVGRRVRDRRKSIKMSQESLAEKLEVSFQQVQKYERGSNRISASKLYVISKALNVEPCFFFEELEATSDGSIACQTESLISLLEKLHGIKNEDCKKHIIGLIESLAIS